MKIENFAKDLIATVKDPSADGLVFLQLDGSFGSPITLVESINGKKILILSSDDNNNYIGKLNGVNTLNFVNWYTKESNWKGKYDEIVFRKKGKFFKNVIRIVLSNRNNKDLDIFLDYKENKKK